MRIAIWIAQIALTGIFLFAGFMKAFQPVEFLHANMPWSVDTPLWVARLAGYAEIVGAIGVILPAVSRIKPILSPIAAAGLGLVMALATILHLSRGELPIPIILLALAAFVAYARWKIAPIEPR